MQRQILSCFFINPCKFALANSLSSQLPVPMKEWQVLNSQTQFFFFFFLLMVVSLRLTSSHRIIGWTADPLAHAPPKRNTLPLPALVTRLLLWKRTVVCRPRDKPSSVCRSFLFSCLFLVPPFSSSFSHCLQFLLLIFFLILSLLNTPHPMDRHTNTHSLQWALDALLCDTLVLFVLCWQKPPNSNPTMDDLCVFTLTWLKGPDCGQTTPSCCPLCQHEQLILGIIISALTLKGSTEVTTAATPRFVSPFFLLIHVSGSKAKQGQALNIRSISHIVCLLASHRCTQNW